MVNVSGVSRTCSLSGGYTQLTVSVVTCVYLHVNQFVLSCPSVFQISKLSPCPQAVFTVEDSAFHSLFFGRPVRLSDIYPNCDTCTSGSTLFGFRQSRTFSVHTGFSSCISCFRWFLSCLVLLQFSRDDLCFFHVSHTVVVLQLRTVWLVGFFFRTLLVASMFTGEKNNYNINFFFLVHNCLLFNCKLCALFAANFIPL